MLHTEIPKKNKILTAEEAISRFVKNGDTVFIGGFGNLYPFALAHEIIRQKRRDLTLFKHSPELIGDQLIGSGCVLKLVFSWLGNPSIGSSHCFRRAVEKGIPNPVSLEEYTHAYLTGMLKAAAMGMTYLPSKALLGSDLFKANSRLKIAKCPFTGENLCLIPAVSPDVSLIHAQRADAQGNTQAWGVVSDIRDGAFASKNVIVSVEEVVSEETIRRDPNRTLIPSFIVDAVVEEVWGAHPSAVQGYYDRDNEFFMKYYEETKTPEGFKEFIDEWVYGVKNRKEYLNRLGVEKMLKLRPKSFSSFAVDYGRYC